MRRGWPPSVVTGTDRQCYTELQKRNISLRIASNESSPAKRLTSKLEDTLKFPPSLTLCALTLTECSPLPLPSAHGLSCWLQERNWLTQAHPVQEARFLSRFFQEWNQAYVIKWMKRHLVYSLTLLRFAHFIHSDSFYWLQLTTKRINHSVHEVKHFHCDITTWSWGLSC